MVGAANFNLTLDGTEIIFSSPGNFTAEEMVVFDVPEMDETSMQVGPAPTSMQMPPALVPTLMPVLPAKPEECMEDADCAEDAYCQCVPVEARRTHLRQLLFGTGLKQCYCMPMAM